MIISISTYFDLNTRKVRIKDTSNYLGQGVSLSDVKGVLTINTPKGAIYQNENYNSPDISPASSVFSQYFSLPPDVKGYTSKGTYVITYSVNINNAVTTLTQTYTYSFILPEIAITQTPDGYNSTFGSLDATDYGTYDSLTRTHTVTPPTGSSLSPQTSANSAISYSANIWSGLWTTSVSSVLEYTHNNLILQLTLSSTQTVFAYNPDMDVIRGYVEVLRLRYYNALKTDRDLAYNLKDRMLLIGSAYLEYDQALYYNDLYAAYQQAVNIWQQLNDVIPTPSVEEITPFINHGSSSTHSPVSIDANRAYGTTINGNQVLSFALANQSTPGMTPALSGNASDYLGGDGQYHSLTGATGYALKTDFADYGAVTAVTTQNLSNWNSAFGWGNHALAGYLTGASLSGYALKSDFSAYASVTAITAANIANWNSAFSWGNHASAGYAVASNFYTKTQLQTSGQAQVHWGNVTNKPTFFDGTWNSLSGKPTKLSQFTNDSGFITVFTETDPTVPSYVKTITQVNITNWNSAATNSHTHSNKTVLDNIINSGQGYTFLADNGTYQALSVQNAVNGDVIIYNNGLSRDSGLNYLSNVLSAPTILATTQLNLGASTVNIKKAGDDMVFTDVTVGSKTLSQLISGATNYWSAFGSGIDYPGFVGVNSPTSLDYALTVNGDIAGNEFLSSIYRYTNSNVLIGNAAGSTETGQNKLYIGGLVYGELNNALWQFNCDTVIAPNYSLQFVNSSVKIYGGVGSNLTFQDSVANSGNAVTLTSLMDGTYNALKSDFSAYNTVRAITASNVTTWNKASYIVTNGAVDKYLNQQGQYVSITGVTPPIFLSVTNANLDGNYAYTYAHNKNTKKVRLSLYDNNGIEQPTAGIFQATDLNTVTIYFNNPIEGTWTGILEYWA